MLKKGFKLTVLFLIGISNIYAATQTNTGVCHSLYTKNAKLTEKGKYFLYQAYSNNIVTKTDYQLAYTCLEEAAKAGYPDAQYEMGNLYWSINSKTNFPNIDNASKDQRRIIGYAWMRAAALNGDDAAKLVEKSIQANLTPYELGEGTAMGNKLSKLYASSIK